MSIQNEIVHRLSKSSFLADMPKKILKEFAFIVKERVIPAYTFVFHQGDRADSFYIIDSGSVRILRKRKEGLETELRRLAIGDSFGEMAILTGDARAASVKTLERTRLFVISKRGFNRIIKDNPHISSVFFKKLSNWLVHTDLRIELAEEKLSKLHKNLHTLSSRITEIEEVERRRIARELHDQVGQNLTALNINLDLSIQQLSDESSGRVLSRLQDSKGVVKEIMKLVRNMMADLRPRILDDYGLAAAIKWYSDQFSKRTKIPVVFKGEEFESSLSSDVETNLFRIMQESLTNVAKHAHANKVTITLEEINRKIRLAITDDGIGFNPTRIKRSKSKGLGMISMKERAEALGGTLHVKSSSGKGTQVIVELEK